MKPKEHLLYKPGYRFYRKKKKKGEKNTLQALTKIRCEWMYERMTQRFHNVKQHMKTVSLHRDVRLLYDKIP